MAVSVREATLDDIPDLVAMGRALHAESPRFARLTFDEEKVAALIRSMVHGTLVTDPVGGALVAVKAGRIIGMFGGYITTPYFSQDKVASDYTFYVVPEHRRKGRAALMLLKAFEAWAIAQGAVELMPGISTMIDTESTTRFYEKLGYSRHGYVLIKRVQ